MVNVNRRSKVINENAVGLIFVVTILALAINIKVVTQIDKRIKVLDIKSMDEFVEIDTYDEYWIILRDKGITVNKGIIT